MRKLELKGSLLFTLLDATCNLELPDPVQPNEKILWEVIDPLWDNDWFELWQARSIKRGVSNS